MQDLARQHREFLKDTIRLETDFSRTAQNRGTPPPPIQLPLKNGQTPVFLPEPGSERQLGALSLYDAIANRKSRRVFADEPLLLSELSFLLFTTQGIRSTVDEGHAFRTVPSAGCRHAFETFLLIRNVGDLDPGIYRYLPREHALVCENPMPETELKTRLIHAALGQRFISKAAAVFVWVAVPARMEWRYGPCSHKVMALDAGHICQNLYLACEAVSAGTCAIAAYHQMLLDELLGVDGEDLFAVYLAPVGKYRSSD